MLNGLDTFDTAQCSPAVGLTAELNPLDSFYTSNPFFSNRATFDTPDEILDSIKKFAFAGVTPSTTAGSFPSPACTKQAAQPSIGQINESSDYTHVYANP